MTITTKAQNLRPSRSCSVFQYLAGLVLATSLAFGATNPSPQLQISLSGPPNTPQPELSWASQPDAVYTLEHRTGLDSFTPWETLEPIIAVSNRTVLRPTLSPGKTTEFFRLELPQAAILRVEPAVGPTSGGTTLYIIGQCLGSGGQVRIGGVILAVETLQAGSLYRGILPPLSEGIYDVEWLEGGQVVTTAYKLFSVIGQPSPAWRMIEPPSEPFASPAKVIGGGVVRGGINILSGNRIAVKGGGKIKGGIIIQSGNRKGGMVNGTISVLNGNRTFDVQEGKKGLNAVNVKLAFADRGGPFGGGVGTPGDAYEVQEGKKGLNAVNVKLARMIGGGTGSTTGHGPNGQGLRYGGTDCDDTDGPVRGGGGGGGGSGDCDDRLMPFSGEIQLEAVDLAVAGRGLDFIWARTYRSRTGRTTPMGINWDHSYNIHVAPDAAGMAVHDGTGRRDVYFPGTNGIYVRDEFFNEGSLSNNAFTLTFPDTGKWIFNAFGASPAAGKISRIEDRNGNALRFEYDGNGLLVRVIDTLDRTNTIAYAGSFVLSVTDFSGRAVTYDYAPPSAEVPLGVLTLATSPSVTGTPNGNNFPTGKRTQYGYSSGFGDDRLNRNLTSIMDPKGQTWLQVVYRTNQDPAAVNFDVVDYVQRGPYRVKLRRFPQTPAPENNYAVVKCIINDEMGNVSECFYDSQNRCLRQLDYTGRASPDLPTTESVNRPVNRLRLDDPVFFEMRWEWNLDSLCTRAVHPRGNSTEMIYQRAFNQNSSRSNNAKRHDGDLRVLRELACCAGDVGGDGLPQLTERTWRYKYDSRFGSPEFASRTTWAFAAGPRQTTSQDGSFSHREVRLPDDQSGPIVRSAPAGVVESAKIITDRDSGRSKGFGYAIFVEDPLRMTTACTYDAHGNRVLLSHSGYLLGDGDRPVMNFEYNAFGQLTACVNAADATGQRRRDEWIYYESGPQRGYLHHHVTDCIAAGFHLTNRFETDVRGNVVRHVDPRGFDTLFTLNALDQMVQRQTPKRDFGSVVRSSTFFTYDANDNLVQVDEENRDESDVLDPDNPLWTVFAEYDVLNRTALLGHELTHVVQQRSVTNRFTYDGNDNLVGHLLPEAVSGDDPNNRIAYQYDERRLPLRTTHAPGSPDATADEYDYDANGNLRALRHGLVPGLPSEPAVTLLAYDGFDQRVRATDPMGNVDTCVYDARGDMVYYRREGEMNDVPGSASNRRYHEWRWTNDLLGRCVESRGSFFDIFTELPLSDGFSVTTFSYAPNGQLERETDDNGHPTIYSYDSVWRLSSLTDAKSNAVVYGYDANDNVILITEIDRSDGAPGAEQRFTHQASFDGLDRCVSSSDNVGNTLRYAYDSRGNAVSEIDAQGNETVRRFNGKYYVTGATHYVGGKERGITINTTHVEYRNDRCVSETDGNGQTTQYFHDGLDRIVRKRFADGTECSLIWSPRSNVSRSTDANGTVVNYVHDLLDRCTRKNIAVGPDVVAATTFEEFTYDAMSRLVLGTNDASMIEYGYDSLGNRAEAKADCLAAFATFDGVGNRLSLTYPGGRIANYTYDAGNHVATIGSAPVAGGAMANLATLFYEGPDRLARITRPSEIHTRIYWNGLQNLANSPGDFGWRQVSRVNHQRAGGGTIVAQRTSTYDPNQNKKSTVAAPFVPGGAVITSALRYDPLDRLSNSVYSVGAMVTLSTEYVLDANGNRLLVMEDGAPQLYEMNPMLPEPADFQMNQYTSTPFGTQEFDRNGNLTFRDSPTGGTTYHYDYDDRLVRVDHFVGPRPVTVASFTYDVLGRRTSKTTHPPGAASVTRQFIHDPDSDGDCILEFREGPVVKASFIPEVNDEVLVGFTTAGNVIYFHADEVGSIVALTDSQGEVLEHYEYEDYGAVTFRDSKGVLILGMDGQPVSESPLGNPFLFHGMYYDSETVLYREGLIGSNPFYQEPKTGRLLTRQNDCCMNGDCVAGPNAMRHGTDSPWTDLPGPRRMKPGVVKFFNDAKGFGRVIVTTKQKMFLPGNYRLAPALLKVKEKGNRTKSSGGGVDQPYTPAMLKVKEKGNRTKCHAN